jgi:hypothetical protein
MANYDNGYRPAPYVCTPTSSSGLADMGAANCSRADQATTLFEPTVLNNSFYEFEYPQPG